MSETTRFTFHLPARPSLPSALVHPTSLPSFTQRAVPPPPLEYTLNPSPLSVSNSVSLPVEPLRSPAALQSVPPARPTVQNLHLDSSMPTASRPLASASSTSVQTALPLSLDSLQHLVVQQSLLIQQQAAQLNHLTVSYDSQLRQVCHVNEALLAVVKALTVSQASDGRTRDHRSDDQRASKRKRPNSSGIRAGIESAR